jgi:hypothetical protein
MSRRARIGAAALLIVVGAIVGWTASRTDNGEPSARRDSTTTSTAERTPPPPTTKPARHSASAPAPAAPNTDDASKGAAESKPSAVEHRRFLVRTADDRPIAGATITASNSSSDDRSTTTEADGRAHIDCERRDRVIVTADGFASRAVQRPKSVESEQVVVLSRPSFIAGLVTDTAGRPVAGAEISGTLEGVVRTGDDGRFRLTDVDPTDWEVCVHAKAYPFLDWEGDVHPGDDDVRVRLARPCVVEGRLVFPDGRAASSGQVEAENVGVSIDTDGSFEFSELTAGDHELRARSDRGDRAFVGAVDVHLAEGQTLRDVRIVLRESPPSFAVLRVVGPDGVPVTFAAARAVHVGGASSASGGLIVVPMDGPPGREEVVTLSGVSSGDVQFGDVFLNVVTRATPDGEPTVVTLPRVALLEVRVITPDAASTDRLSVRVGPTNRQSLHIAAPQSSKAQSTFRIAAGGSYRVHVEAARFAPVDRDVTPEEFAAGRAVIKLSAGATVKVHVVARPPARISEPWVMLCASAPIEWALSPGGGAAPDGRYAIEHVRAGRCEARIACCGSITQKTLTIDVPESGVLDLGDVVVDGTTTMKGRVTTPDGRPAGGAELEYFDARRVHPVDGVHALTKPDGTFAFEVPVGATGDLCVSKTELGAVMIPLDGKGAWTEVRLGAECRLRLIFRAKSADVWSPSVALSRPGGTALWCPPLDGDVREGATETIHVCRGLAPGKWSVRLHDEEPAIEREVTLVAGETTELVIDEPK